MNVLIVLTSNDRLGDTEEPTGFWLEEFAAPYYRLVDAGHEVTLASPKGGQPPVDPKSLAEDAHTEATRRFEADDGAQARLARTRPLAEIDADAFDAVFYPGGHGPLWDLAEDKRSVRLIETMLRAGRPVAAVCHGPAVLLAAMTGDGKPAVAGRRVTGFSDAEEAAVGLTDAVPFSIEKRMKALGAAYEAAEAFAPHAVSDGPLITGQNPASSEKTADLLIAALGARQAA